MMAPLTEIMAQAEAKVKENSRRERIAEALECPEVAALVKAAKYARDEIKDYGDCGCENGFICSTCEIVNEVDKALSDLGVRK